MNSRCSPNNVLDKLIKRYKTNRVTTEEYGVSIDKRPFFLYAYYFTI